MKPENQSLWTVNRLASELGLDRRTLGRRLAGVAPARAEGRSRLYRLPDVLQAIAAGATNGPPELTQERARLVKLQGDRLELANRVRAGEVVAVDEVKRAAFAMARRTRDQLLALPDRLASTLAAEHEAAGVRSILGAEIERICLELSDGRRPGRRTPGASGPA